MCNHKPSDVTEDELKLTYKNYSKLRSLMDLVLSILHSNRREIIEQKNTQIKHDLNLVRIKWMEMDLSYALTFCMIHKHVFDFLLNLNECFDMVEDAIKRWYQIRMRHH